MRNTFLLFFIFLAFPGFSQEKLFGNDLRLFKGTAWELAKAVRNQNISKINKILTSGKIPVNYQEPKFGQTLLIWAVANNRYKSAETLLKNGADPNLQSTYDGTSALMEAANKYETSEYLKLLLANGGNPNAFSNSERPNIICTPLVAAARNRLESVKMLVDAGADINFISKTEESALRSALHGNRVEILRYLIIEKGADFKKPLAKTIDNEDIKVVNSLRNWTFPLDSEKYKQKMEIVAFLKQHGEDYWQTPVPQHYYKIYPKEYLEKY